MDRVGAEGVADDILGLCRVNARCKKHMLIMQINVSLIVIPISLE